MKTQVKFNKYILYVTKILNTCLLKPLLGMKMCIYINNRQNYFKFETNTEKKN